MQGLQIRKREPRGRRRGWIWCAAGLLSVCSAAAQSQLSGSAYRALGQPDLRQNGLNMVQGGELNAPNAVALDSSDGQLHLYIADTRNHRVVAWQDARAFQNGEAPTLVLGQPSPQHVNPEGIGPRGFNAPTGLAVDPTTGNLYVADSGHNRVLRFARPFANPSRIEPDAVYGQPNLTSFSPNTGGITDHSLRQPLAVACDSLGNLWVADTGNHRLLRFPAAALEARSPAADAVIGQKDFNGGSGNQGLGTVNAAGLDWPSGMAFDQQNTLIVADSNNTRILRFVFPQGTNQAANVVLGEPNFNARGVPPQPSASTLAGPAGLAVDGIGNLYVAVPGDNRILVFAVGSSSTTPAKAVLGQDNFTANSPNGNFFPQASASTLYGVADVKVDPDGFVYAADTRNNRVVVFPPSSKSAMRVLGQTDFSANGANQVKPGSINAPYKMAVDYSQSPFALYVSDTNNNRVLVWKDAASFRTGAAADLVMGQPDLRTGLPNVDSRSLDVPSRTSLRQPKGLVVDAGGALYVADSGNHRVLRFPRPVDQAGRITPDAVIGQVDFTSAASAAVNAAALRNPTGLALGPNGNLFVADSGNNRVLEFRAGAGLGAAAIRVYGQPNFTTGAAPSAVSAQTLSAPQGLFVDGSYNLYIADQGANRVVIYPNTKDAPPSSASAAIVIGQDAFNLVVNGSGPNRFRGPLDVAVDSAGTIYVSDSGNNRVLTFPSLLFLPFSGGGATGVIGQRDASSAAPNWNSPDGLATAEGLFGPTGIFLDRKDTMYVADAGNSRVVHILHRAAVVNAAHFQSGVPVARGAIVSLFGAGISDDSQVAQALPLPRALAGREVVVNDEFTAPLLFASPGQVNFQLPSAAPLGAQRIAVRTLDTAELLAGGTVLISSSAPGFFTASQDGKGQGAILNQDGSLNKASNPAVKGSVVQLFGVGQGEVSPAVPDGEPAPSGALAATVATPTSDGATCLNKQPAVCVVIGSTFGEVLYSGLTPGYVGLWQINVKIPENALSGPAVPVRAVINATPSNIVTLAIR